MSLPGKDGTPGPRFRLNGKTGFNKVLRLKSRRMGRYRTAEHIRGAELNEFRKFS